MAGRQQPPQSAHSQPMRVPTAVALEPVRMSMALSVDMSGGPSTDGRVLRMAGNLMLETRVRSVAKGTTS